MSQNDFLKRREQAIPRGPFHVSPLVVQRAEGAYVWDPNGKRYLDFCGGIGTLNVGHNHPKVVAAIRQQADSLLHACWHVAMYEPYLELAERLNALAPIPGPNKTVLFNSGAEAVENAVKIARSATKRPAVIAFERGFHGRTLLSMTLTGKVQPYTSGFGPFAPEIYRLPYAPFYTHQLQWMADDLAPVKKAIDRLFSYHIEPHEIAAIVFEPVLGEGGFLPMKPHAMRYLRDVCNQHGIVLIADEIQSGFGRCGSMFAVERYGVQPDLITMAKSLAGGLPLSAVTGKSAIMDAPQIGGIGGTYGGNPVSCAAALAVLDVFETENLCARAEWIGEKTEHMLQELSDRYTFIANPRRLGAMCAMDVVTPSGEPDKKMASRIVKAALARGLMIMTASGYVIRLLMPLTIQDQTLVEGLEALSLAVSDVHD